MLRIWPFRAIKAVTKDARNQFQILKNLKRANSSSPVIVRFDLRASHPGFGDLFLLIMIANYLHDLGFAVRFSSNLSLHVEGEFQDSYSQKNKSELLVNWLREEIQVQKQDCLPDEELKDCLFANRVAGDMDVSGPSLLLMSLIYASKSINPGSHKPRLHKRSSDTSPVDHESDLSNLKTVGFHVRGSLENKDRNPALRIVLSDFLVISSQFPTAEIVWFGERNRFDEFTQFALEAGLSTVRLRYQRASSFSEAISEMLELDFWYQRLGGGIGAVSLFSDFPYLILSGDARATRMYLYTSGRLVPWATKNQRYFLLNRRNRSLQSFF